MPSRSVTSTHFLISFSESARWRDVPDDTHTAGGPGEQDSILYPGAEGCRDTVRLI